MTFTHDDFTTRPVTPIGDGAGLAAAFLDPRQLERLDAGAAPGEGQPERDPLDATSDALFEIGLVTLDLGALLFMYECALHHGENTRDGEKHLERAGIFTVETARAFVERIDAATQGAHEALGPVFRARPLSRARQGARA